jgi:hypothetical protein
MVVVLLDTRHDDGRFSLFAIFVTNILTLVSVSAVRRSFLCGVKTVE